MSWDLGIKNSWSKGSARPAETRMDGQVRRLRSDATRHEQPHPPRKKVVANVESVKPNDVYGKGHSTQDERRTESSASLTRAIVTSKEITATEPKRPRAPPKKAFPVHDEYSAEDIHRLLDSINDRIEELATDGAYDWTHLPKHPKGWELKQTWRNEEDKDLMNAIGKPCFDVLKSVGPDDPDASVLLRIAYQAVIVSSLCPALDLFMAALPESYVDDEAVLDILTEEGDRIRDSNGWDAYSLWRTSKHRELRACLSAEDEAENIRGYSKTACIWCFYCTILFMGKHLLDWGSFQSSVLPRLEDITRDILKLSVMIHEGVVTQEYAIYRVTYPEEVDKTKMEIEEDDLDSSSAASDRVLSTTRLGLQCLGNPGPSGRRPSLVVKKARVLTENVVQRMYTDPYGTPSASTVSKAKVVTEKQVLPASLTMDIHLAPTVQPTGHATNVPHPHSSLPERERIATETDVWTWLNHPNLIPATGSRVEEVVVQEASLHPPPWTENTPSLSRPEHRASFVRFAEAASRSGAEATYIQLGSNPKLEVVKDGPEDVRYRYRKMKVLLESRDIGLSGLKRLKLEGEDSPSDFSDMLARIGDLVEELTASSPRWSTIKPRDLRSYVGISSERRLELEEQLGQDLVWYLANTRIQDDYAFHVIRLAWQNLITRTISGQLQDDPDASSPSPEEQASIIERLAASICQMCFHCGCLLLQDDRPHPTTFKRNFLPQMKEIMQQVMVLAKRRHSGSLSSIAAAIDRIRHLEISENRIIIPRNSHLLGRGAYGDEELKRLAKRFVREIDVWARLDHPNIHPLIGFYLASNLSSAWLVSSLCANGNAWTYVRKAKPTEAVRVKLLLDTVKGLQYLHKSKPPIYHGDIKSDNVLITDDIQAVLCDFGLAKVMGPKTGLTTSNPGGTARYLAPEIADPEEIDMAEEKASSAGTETTNGGNFPLLTPERDIWAWGCLVLEIMTERIPYAEKSDGAIYRLLPKGVLPAIVNQEVAQPVRDLMKKCWSFLPKDRPSVSICLETVDEYYQMLSQQ